jgi:hypothetical protein
MCESALFIITLGSLGWFILVVYCCPTLNFNELVATTGHVAQLDRARNF